MWYPDFYSDFLKGIYPAELSNKDKSRLLSSSCRNGHLEVAQWLWSISNETINIHAYNEWAFRCSCYHGHLEVAQWLWSICNGTIDIHACSGWAFRSSCANGHLALAQWLWSISNEMIDIHADECAFRRICENGYQEVAQWLWRISNLSMDKYKIGKKPRYYQNVNEIKIYYIKHHYYKPYTGPGYLRAMQED
jgi:hypothetical protein